MGILRYGAGTEYELDDRILAHLKVVIAAKLRRNESFFVSWSIPPTVGSGRISLWLAPAVPLEIVFYGSREPQLNRIWIDVLAEMSHSPRGLVLISEADAEAVKAGTIGMDQVEALTL